jgi:hypothetical protein
MIEAGRIIGAASEPFRISSSTLEEAYKPFQEGANNHAMMPRNMKDVHRACLLEALSVIEFQASWFVLRNYFDDQKIADMDSSERKSSFVRLLYSDSGRYPFFDAREDAIMALAAAGIINYEEYGATPLSTLLV